MPLLLHAASAAPASSTAQQKHVAYVEIVGSAESDERYIPLPTASRFSYLGISTQASLSAQTNQRRASARCCRGDVKRLAETSPQQGPRKTPSQQRGFYFSATSNEAAFLLPALQRGETRRWSIWQQSTQGKAPLVACARGRDARHPSIQK